jgi:hypothetical protein
MSLVIPIDYTAEDWNNLSRRLDHYEEENAALLMAAAQERIASRAGAIKVPNASTWKALADTLESELWLLLTLPSNTDLNGERTSEHYRRYSRLSPTPVITPNTRYLRELLYTNRRVWCTAHNSLGYYLLLSNYREHYSHPSRLVYEAVNATWRLTNAWKDYYRQLEEDDLSLLYSNFISFLNLPNGIDKVREFLLAIEELSNIDSEVRAILHRYWIAPNTQYLWYDLWHGQLDPSMYDLYSELLTWSIQTDTTNSRLDRLRASLSAEPGLIRQVSAEIVTSLPYPGGLNSLLIAFAARLVNDAYIDAVRNPNAGDLIFSLGVVNTDEAQRLGRIRKRLYIAGSLLRRGTYQHIVAAGANLTLLSQLDNITTPIRNLNL